MPLRIQYWSLPELSSSKQVVLTQASGGSGSDPRKPSKVNVQLKDGGDASRRNTIDLQIGEGRSRKNTLVKVNGEVVSVSHSASNDVSDSGEGWDDSIFQDMSNSPRIPRNLSVRAKDQQGMQNNQEANTEEGGNQGRQIDNSQVVRRYASVSLYIHSSSRGLSSIRRLVSDFSSSCLFSCASSTSCTGHTSSETTPTRIRIHGDSTRSSRASISTTLLPACSQTYSRAFWDSEQPCGLGSPCWLFRAPQFSCSSYSSEPLFGPFAATIEFWRRHMPPMKIRFAGMHNV